MSSSIVSSKPIESIKSSTIIESRNMIMFPVSSYWLTRVIFLRCLSFLLLVAFLIALTQNEALIGEHGLTPSHLFLSRLKSQILGKNYELFEGKNGDKDWVVLIQLLTQHPTLFWVIPMTNFNLNLVSFVGVLMSLFVLIFGRSNACIQFTLWMLYFSIVNIGQTWYSFGWESQLLETTFLSIFLVPMWTIQKYPSHHAGSTVSTLGCRWLLFRIMLGAGLIKLRGDHCWRDLTCMHYHYQTQPVPNPLSTWFHQSPGWFHQCEVMVNHLVEVIFPFFLLMPRTIRIYGGIIQILFQFILILSGNLSFLNWLTILPAIFCFDDRSLAWLMPASELKQVAIAEYEYRSLVLKTTSANHETLLSAKTELILAGLPSLSLFGNVIYEFDQELTVRQSFGSNNISSNCHRSDAGDDGIVTMDDINQLRIRKFDKRAHAAHKEAPSQLAKQEQQAQEFSLESSVNNQSVGLKSSSRIWFWLYGILDLAVCLLIGYLSVPVVLNILSPHQVMNTNFGAFRIVNTYGAFGSITKVRHEVIIQGTRDEHLSSETKWYDYEFPCKPGNINRRPCWLSPFHYRADWLMWFAAFQNYQQSSWIIAIANQLLMGDPYGSVHALLAYDGDPFIRRQRDEDPASSADGAQYSSDVSQTQSTMPRFVRARLYEYQYQTGKELSPAKGNKSTKPKKSINVDDSSWEEGVWWRRKYVREYFPALEANNTSVQQFLHQMGMS